MTNEHPYREEDFDLYALGVLEGDDLRGIETHINSCSNCAQKVAEARGRIALLAFSAEPAEPSLAVRQRLMAHVRAEPYPAHQAAAARAKQARPRAVLDFGVGNFGASRSQSSPSYLWMLKQNG